MKKKVLDMIETFYIFVVAYKRYTRSNVVLGVFPNLKYAEWFRTTFHPTACIWQLPKEGIYFSDYGVEMREGFKPIS